MQISTKNFIFYIVSLSVFMLSVDTTIINTAIPTMAHSLKVNPLDLKLALISYLVSLAIFIPISGWLADKFGTKRVFLCAIIIFTLSSLWCGFSNSLTELVIARILQGIGGSLILPVGRLIIIRIFQRYELIHIMNRIMILASIGPLFGPLLGSIITQHYSWHWIFWINVPTGFIIFLVAWYGLLDTAPRIVPSLDKIGFLLFGSSLASLTFGLSTLSDSLYNSIISVGLIAVSIMLFGMYVWHSRTQPFPIFNKELLKLRTFRISMLGNLLGRIGFGGITFILPLMLQISLSYSSTYAGLLIMPIALGALITKIYSAQLLKKFGFKNLLIINTSLVGLSIWSFAFVNEYSSIYGIAVLTFIFGIVTSLQYSCINPLAYTEIPDKDFNSATSVIGTVQQLGQGCGIAVSALLVRYFSNISSNMHFTVMDFKHVFLALGLITIFGTFIFIDLKQNDGNKMLQAE